jgi:hypothetical protein
MEGGKAVNNLSAYYEKKSTPVEKAYKVIATFAYISK